MTESARFWEFKSLESMSDQEWESLCDGCGRCCLQKLQDEDTEDVHFTRVACRLLDTSNGRCQDYAHRFAQVHDCLAVRPLTPEKISWLPESCAYKKLSAGLPLENWHPLISGTPESVKTAGISVAGRCVSETQVPVSEYFHHLIDWDKNHKE